MSESQYMRTLMKRIKLNNYNSKESINEDKVKSLSMRDMLKITRSLNEDITQINKATHFDQETEENKFRNYFSDLNVVINMIPLEVKDNFVFWGGTINGMVQFVYKVTPNSGKSGVEFNYLDNFVVDNPDNQEIIKRVESYYDVFFKYWNENNFENK